MSFRSEVIQEAIDNRRELAEKYRELGDDDMADQMDNEADQLEEEYSEEGDDDEDADDEEE